MDNIFSKIYPEGSMISESTYNAIFTEPFEGYEFLSKCQEEFTICPKFTPILKDVYSGEVFQTASEFNRYLQYLQNEPLFDDIYDDEDEDDYFDDDDDQLDESFETPRSQTLRLAVNINIAIFDKSNKNLVTLDRCLREDNGSLVRFEQDFVSMLFETCEIDEAGIVKDALMRSTDLSGNNLNPEILINTITKSFRRIMYNHREILRTLILPYAYLVLFKSGWNRYDTLARNFYNRLLGSKTSENDEYGMFDMVPYTNLFGNFLVFPHGISLD